MIVLLGPMVGAIIGGYPRFTVLARAAVRLGLDHPGQGLALTIAICADNLPGMVTATVALMAFFCPWVALFAEI